MFRWLSGLFALLLTGVADAETYHVAVNGVDVADRNGLTEAMAWASLAFACEQVSEGTHTIRLGAGTFTAQRTAKLKSGWTVVGAGRDPATGTVIVADKKWELVTKFNKEVPENEFMIAMKKVKDIHLSALVIVSPTDRHLTGGIFCMDGENIELTELYVHDFRWAGMMLNHSRKLNVHHNLIENASSTKMQHHGGLIRTTWIKESEIHHNRILATVGEGYGYKGGGHEAVRFHHNHVEVAGEFAFESAHENEFGLEIDHNYLNRCCSVPKGGQGADPNSRGHAYSVWLHHNIMTDSYTVEGPRNHLRLSHNYIRIEKTGGRVYTQHGGKNKGPVWIHHNVIEKLDRAFVWMNEGLAEDIQVFNNTVFCADAGDRTGAIFGAYSGERLNNWVVKNNIFVAPMEKPRALFPTQRGVNDKIKASGNVVINMTDVPDGNQVGQLSWLSGSGERPWPFFASVEPNTNLIDAGVDQGQPFHGIAPDIGAFEHGLTKPFPVVGPDAP